MPETKGYLGQTTERKQKEKGNIVLGALWSLSHVKVSLRNERRCWSSYSGKYMNPSHISFIFVPKPRAGDICFHNSTRGHPSFSSSNCFLYSLLIVQFYCITLRTSWNFSYSKSRIILFTYVQHLCWNSTDRDTIITMLVWQRHTQ